MSADRIIFMGEEKYILVTLVSVSIRTAEDKKMIAMPFERKKEEWSNITEKFNGCCNVRCCTSAQLRKCWMNIKAR